MIRTTPPQQPLNPEKGLAKIRNSLLQLIQTIQQNMGSNETGGLQACNFDGVISCDSFNGKDSQILGGSNGTLRSTIYILFNNNYINKSIWSNEKNVGPPLPVKTSVQVRSEEFIPLAEQLAHIVRQEKNVNITPSKITNWANEIRRLCEVDGVSCQRIKVALDWYAVNTGGQYIPIIESGGSLRNKFTRLEDAMKRYDKPPTPITENPPATNTPPKKIIINHFKNQDVANFFYSDCYAPALWLFNGPVGKSDLAAALISLLSQIEKEQDKNLSQDLRELLPGPIDLVSNYLEWIKDNDWINSRTIGMLDIKHTLFTRFRREEARKDNMERDALNGCSYMRGWFSNFNERKNTY